MHQSFGRRLRLAFGRHDTPVPVVDEESGSPAAGSEVEFVAYAEDCVLSGRARLQTTRLTDMLNTHDEYQLLDVMVERFDGQPAVEVREVLAHRDEILLVHATGPRGDLGRRQRTRQHPLALQIGPYLVRGTLHALPGTDPIASFRRRKTMVPLTDASIEYGLGAKRQQRRVGAVVINREQVDWVVPGHDDSVEMLELPTPTSQGPLVKDFTGQIWSEGMDPSEPMPA